jgi:hypothetical protein
MKVEFEINTRRVLMPAIAGVLALFVLHAAYPALYTYWPADSAQMAAWVQAFVSAVAVGAGAAAIYWQVSRQSELEREQSTQEVVRKLQALNHAAFRLRLELVLLRSHVRGGQRFKQQIYHVERVAATLAAVPLMDLPTVEASHAVFNCTAAVTVLSTRLRQSPDVVEGVITKLYAQKRIDEALGFVVDAEALLLHKLGELGSGGLDMHWEHDGVVYVNGRPPQ